MKRKYLALLLAAATTVSQISGTTSFALAADLIVEPEIVETTVETTTGDLTTPLDGEGDAVAEETALEVQSSGENSEQVSETTVNQTQDEEAFKELLDEAENDSDMDVLDSEEQGTPSAEGDAVSDGAVSEEDVEAADPEVGYEYLDAAELNLDSSDFLAAVELADTQEVEALNLADETAAVTQNEEQSNLGLQIYVDCSSGIDRLRPGESVILSVEACVDAEDENGNGYREEFKESNQIALDYELIDGADKLITINEVEGSDEWRDSNTRCRQYIVTAKSNALTSSDVNGEPVTLDEIPAKIRFTAYRADESDEPLTDNSDKKEQNVEVTICSDYTKLLPVSIDQMAAGEVRTITAEYKYYWLDAENQQQEEVIDNVRYVWEWDSEQIKIWYEDEDGNEVILNSEDNCVISKKTDDGADSSGVEFYLQKLTNDENSTRVHLYAQEQDDEDNWQESWHREYEFGRIDYISDIKEVVTDEDTTTRTIDFDEQIFSAESITLCADICDKVSKLYNWEIEWQVGFWNEKDETVEALDNDTWKAYSVSGDKKEQITLNGAAIQKALNLQDDQWFGVWAYANFTLNEGEDSLEADRYDRGICFKEESYELRDLCWEDDEVLPGWEDSFRKETTVWVRNAQYPDGANLPAKITGVVTKRSKHDTESTEIPVSAEEGCWDDGTACYKLKAEHYGCADVIVQYQIGTYNENGEANYDDNSKTYEYTYEVNVAGDRFGVDLKSDRDAEWSTDLRPGESVTLYAETWADYEYWPEDEEDYPTITVNWTAEDAALVELEPNEDGSICKVTAKNTVDKSTTVWADVMVQWPEQKEANWRAREGWNINISDQYFYVTLDAGTEDKSYDTAFIHSLENGESITVMPVLNGAGGAEVPGSIIWRWEDWDSDQLTITDVNDKVLKPEDNSGTAPFTITKIGRDWTDIRLKAYEEDEGQCASARFIFEDVSYDIWYNNLRDDGWTWYYTDENDPTIELDSRNLKDKDKYQLVWYLGSFDEHGELIEDLKIEQGTDKGYTVSDDGAVVNLNLTYLESWMQKNKTDHFSVRAYILSSDKNADETYDVLAEAGQIEVELRDSVCDYNFDLDMGDERVIRPCAGNDWWLNQTFNIHVENAEYPYGKDFEGTINNVTLDIDENYPQKAILLAWYEAENENESNGWNLQFLNPCEGTLTIEFESSYTDAKKEVIPIEVQGETYSIDFQDIDNFYLYPGDEMEIETKVSHWIHNQYWNEDEPKVSLEWEIERQWDLDWNPLGEEDDPVLELVTAGEGDRDRQRTVKAMNSGIAAVTVKGYVYDEENETSYQVAENTVVLYVNTFYIYDVNQAATYQYADFGQSVELKLKLQQQTKTDPEDYSGVMRYIFESDEGNITAECLSEDVKVYKEDGKMVIELVTAEEETNTTAEEETNTTDDDRTVAIALSRCDGGWGSARITAQIQNEKGDWQDAARREWYFDEYSKDIWPEDAREYYYTWIYSDEEDYSLTMGIGDGLLANDRWMEYTIGIAQGEKILATYPISTSDDNGTNYSVAGSTLTIADGGDLGAWITEQKAAWQSTNPDADPDDCLETFIEAKVMMEIAEEDAEEGTEENTSNVSVQEEVESSNTKTVEVSSCRLGFDVRDSQESWEDSDVSELLLGDTYLYYDYDEQDGCYWIGKYVENAKYPRGKTLYYPLQSIESSNAAVLQVRGDMEQGEQIQIAPVAAGEATLTYTIQIGNTNETFEFDKTVITSEYYVSATLDGGSNIKPDESKRLRVVVKELRTTYGNEGNPTGFERVALSEDQYTVAYRELTNGYLDIDENGLVTVKDTSARYAQVLITVTIPQGENDSVEIEHTKAISLADDWYEIRVDDYDGCEVQYNTTSGDMNCSAAPEDTVSLTPTLYYMTDHGESETALDVDYFELEEEWRNGNAEYTMDNATIKVYSADQSECYITLMLTAHYTDDYGDACEASTYIWIGFCNHEHDESEEWQVAYWSTCSETGLKECWCSKCGWVMETKEIAKVAHSWDGGETTKQPTCTAEGKKTYTCTECSATKTESIAKTEHKAGSWTLQNGATCTTGGTEIQKCTACGTTISSRSTGAKGHTPGKWQTEKAATCTATGKEVQKCTVCGTTINSRTVAAKGHSWGSYTVTKQATAVAAGTETHSCKNCGTSESRTVAKLTPTIKLTATKLNLQLKKSASLKSLVTNLASGDAIASWTSSNTKIVTVDKNGKITGKKVGSADILVTLKSELSAKITVTVQKKAVATTKVTVESKSITLTKGKKTTLNPIVTPITTTDKVTYKTSNKKVATVDSKGQVTAKASGTATITIKSGKKSVKVKVTVKAIQPTKITGVPTSKTLKKGKTLTLKPKLSPAGSEATIKYSTSNKKVATVSSKGKITAKKKGTAVITVKAGNVTTSCTITVR